MQLTFRSNPKTTGWERRAAITLLAGIGTFLLALPLSFFLFLRHFQSAYPDDTQNLLSALTASVLVGLGLALLASTATLIVTILYKRLGIGAGPGV